jgi:hypothetical protein
MEINDSLAGGANGPQEISLLDVHVKGIQAYAAFGSHAIGHRDRLVCTVDEIGLEPI